MPQGPSDFKRHFAPRKLLFYLIFHGLHIGVFALGWYVQYLVEVYWKWLETNIYAGGCNIPMKSLLRSTHSLIQSGFLVVLG